MILGMRQLPTNPLSLLCHFPERSSPSRVRYAAQNQRALDRSGPFRKLSLKRERGPLQRQTLSPLVAGCRLPLVGPDPKSALPP